MKVFLQKHSFVVMAALAGIFLLIIVGYYLWAIGYLLHSENAAVTTQSLEGQVTQFNLEGGAQLDLRGVSTTP